VRAESTAIDAGRDPVARREAWIALAERWVEPAEEALATEPSVGAVHVEVLNGKELDFERA
jgi:hypothetical protein